MAIDHDGAASKTVAEMHLVDVHHSPYPAGGIVARAVENIYAAIDQALEIPDVQRHLASPTSRASR